MAEAWLEKMIEEAKTHLPCFLQDNSDKSAEELERLAEKLSPGGAHTGGELVNEVRAKMPGADPLLIAATIRVNWHGGKVGFQFLPDPLSVSDDEYMEAGYELAALFDDALDGNPLRILTGEDLAFYNSLPEQFTIYRGCAGISPELAGSGVCWTTRRDIAEWFARRAVMFNRDAAPVVMTNRTKKRAIWMAKALEYEIVALPGRSRQIKCRPRKCEKPVNSLTDHWMQWRPPE